MFKLFGVKNKAKPFKFNEFVAYQHYSSNFSDDKKQAKLSSLLRIVYITNYTLNAKTKLTLLYSYVWSLPLHQD